jgi:hypothetical protein
MNSENTSQIVGKIVDLLKPLESEDRRRVVHASLVLLGEKPAAAMDSNSGDEQDGVTNSLPPRVRIWLKQNALSVDQLQHVFDFAADGVTVIASEITGKNNAEKTIKAYVLAGAAKFLATGDQDFDDKTARALCESLGFYDPTNHMKHMKQKGSYFTGSKETGWKLTAPGLKYAATLIRELAEKAQ